MRNRLFTYVALLILVTGAFVACGDDDVGNPTLPDSDEPDRSEPDVTADSATDADTHDAADAGDLEDAGDLDSDVEDGDGDAPIPNLNGSGWIVVSSHDYAVGEEDVSGYSVVVTFEETEEVGEDQDTCTEREEGACRVTVCHDGSGDSDPPPDSRPHAGTVSVNGGSELLTLVPNETGIYPIMTNSEAPLFTGGESLTIAAAGALAPAFSVDLTAPHAIELTAPELPDAPSPWGVDRTSNIELAWEGGQGRVEAVFFSASGHVSCVYDADDGSATIPAAAIGTLEGSGTFSVSVIDRETLELGGWQLTITATSPGVNGEKLASGPVVFQ